MIFRLDPNIDKARNARPNDVMNYYNLKITYVLVHSFRLFIYKSFSQYKKKNRQPHKKRTNQRRKRSQNTKREKKSKKKEMKIKLKNVNKPAEDRFCYISNAKIANIYSFEEEYSS